MYEICLGIEAYKVVMKEKSMGLDPSRICYCKIAEIDQSKKSDPQLTMLVFAL